MVDWTGDDLDDDLDRHEGRAVRTRVLPETGSDDWLAMNTAVLWEWRQWVGRIKEFRSRRSRLQPPVGWFGKQQRRFSDSLLARYGISYPDGHYMEWRRRKAESSGRHEEVQALNARQPWE